MSQKLLTQILHSLKEGDRIAVSGYEDHKTEEGHVQIIGEGWVGALMNIDGEETYAEFYEDDTAYNIEVIG